MAKLIAVPAHSDHICWIANNMTQGERDECAAMGLGPFQALRDSLDRSASAWTGMLMPGARPLCMFGVVPVNGLLSGVGEPWFASTDELARYKAGFLKRNGEFIRKMTEIFPCLIGYVDVRHTGAHRWLRWLGFRVGPGIRAVKPFGMPFYKFEMGV
jgi:hypothetical protein